MADGKVLQRVILTVKAPIPTLPRYFAYIHTIANSPSYYSNGSMRTAENHCIFHYTLRGRGICYNEYGRFETRPGQGFLSIIHDPKSGYSYPVGETEEWEFLVFCFESGNSIDLFQSLIREFGPIYDLDRNCDSLTELTAAAQKNESHLQTPFESSVMFYKLYTALAEAGARDNTNQADNDFHPYIKAARTLIQNEIAQDPSIDEIALRLGLSREYLSRLFKAETGKTLKEYIREQRIIRICKLLKNSKLTISEISDAMNFSSSSNFIRFFHDALNVTPAEFRRSGGIPDIITLSSNKRITE